MDVMKLSKICKYKLYNTNEIIFNEGDPGDNMYIILAGTVTVYINSSEAVLIPVSQLKPGDFFGEMSLLEKAPRSATIQTNENTTLLLINESNFDEVICSDPALAVKIMKTLSKRIRLQNEVIHKHVPPNLQKQTTEIQDSLEINQLIEKESNLEIISPEKTELNAYQLFQSHTLYNLTAPLSHVQYLFLKKVLCPVCGDSFETIAFRSSKLRVQKVDPDFRRRYLDFDPLWYSIWVCPHCFYANITSEFEQIAEKAKKAILEHKDIKNSNFIFTNPRRLDQIFRAYYLNLHWVESLMQDSEKMGRLWLRLAWLYDDVGDITNSNNARINSLNFYKDSHFNSNKRLTPPQEQYVTLLMGELALRINLLEDAKKFFQNSIVQKGGNDQMNQQARDRLIELKGKS